MNETFNKSTLPYEWHEMLLSAKEYFDTNSQSNCKFHQCIVLCMDDGKQFTYPITADDVEGINQASQNLAGLLAERDNTVIKRIVCMWDDGGVDVTDFEFRKEICALNKENEKALILLCGEETVYHTKQISQTLPKKSKNHI